MAIVKLTGNNGQGVDFKEFDVSDLFGYSFSTRSAMSLKVFDDTTHFARFAGTGLTYSVSGGVLSDIKSGVFTEIKVVDSGVTEFSYTFGSVSAARLYDCFQLDDSDSALKLLLAGDDTITGTPFDDRIGGGRGDDTVKGGQGSDRVSGGPGHDALWGGGGADAFVFNDLTDSLFARAERDRIEDFSRRQGDFFDLHKADADKTTGGNQSFTFIGANAFSGDAGELRYERDASKDLTHVYGDVNGDGKADFAFDIGHSIALRAGDFLL